MSAMVALALLVGVLVPVCATLLLIHRTSVHGTDQIVQTSEKELTKRAFDQLVAVREIKKNQIERYLRDRVDLMTDVQKNLRFTGGVRELALAFTKGIDSAAYQAAYDQRVDGLTVFRDVFGFKDVFLIDPEGNVLFSAAREADLGENLVSGRLKNTGLAEAFQRGTTETSLVDFGWYEPSNEPGAFLSTPLRDETGRLLGVAAFQVSLRPIKEIMGERSGMGETGGTYLVGEDRYLRCDSPLDHTPGTVVRSFDEQVRVDSESVARALEGKTGQGHISIEVDGQPQMILSAYTPIDVDGTRWALLAEIDEAEALAAVDHVRRVHESTASSLAARTIGLSGVCLLAIVLVGLGIHWKIALPIRRMVRAASVAAEGDLDVRMVAEGKSEVAALGQAFNRLITSLTDVVAHADSVARGDHSVEIRPRSEQDALGVALFEMNKTLRDVVTVCEAVAVGDYSAEVSVKGDKDLLGHALNQMITNLRTVVEQINSAGSQMASASREQAEGAKNQSVATEEIATTVSELLASARKVAESARNVSEQAALATNECASGKISVEGTVQRIRGVQQRVEKIGAHMLELGSKSQQISGVLDIITELSEQTHLLSLNASIEAAGAGEAGTRFAVVASEIRKLADRATNSTGEIRSLIESVQETVNAAIMATEEGAKAVREGVQSAEEVDKSFGRIAEQVASTTQSARAIEMGSRQQATAVEQMEGAVRNVDTAARQTAETARQLDANAETLLETARRLQGTKQELQTV